MYALADAVSCYAMIEKSLDPSIRQRPVLVASNNDGAVVAICPIAKSLGLKKFVPLFKLKNEILKYNVVVRSSNYELYADISKKMMNVIASFCDNQYVYSIDECFLHFENYERIIDDWHAYGHVIRKAVWKHVKMPIGVGFSSTLTLSKAANHASKKLSGFDGVAVINNEVQRKAILSRMATTDVWGIGSRLGKHLSVMGINSALELANQCPKYIRKQFSVVVERTVRELNGTPCLQWDEIPQNKKEIFSTRSFGQRVTEYEALNAALVGHGVTVSRKARSQKSLIKRFTIFAASSPYDNKPHHKSLSIELAVATDNTLAIANAISHASKSLFKPGLIYYRSGFGATVLESAKHRQNDLFSPVLDNPLLMKGLDAINARYGNGTIKLGTERIGRESAMKREFLSPRYTTRWSDIPIINC